MATEQAPEPKGDGVTDDTAALQGQIPEDAFKETAPEEPQEPSEEPAEAEASDAHGLSPEDEAWAQANPKEVAPEEPELTPEDEEAAAKRSEAAKKGAATRAANQAQTQLVEEIYKHLRHTLGAEVSIDQARALVEMVQAPAAE